MREPVRRARELRRTSTDAERKLWSAIRNRALAGYRFRRQVPIGPFIADFVCVEGRLVIELDGSQHAFDEERDHARTGYLNERGYRVIRFWNTDVLTNLEGVANTILGALETPRPPAGEGGAQRSWEGEGSERP